MSKWQICFGWLHRMYILLCKELFEVVPEGAIGNLMNILHCPKNDMEQFWDIVQSPVHLIQQMLGESCVPKAVLKTCGVCDSIQKSLWILWKKTNSALQVRSELILSSLTSRSWCSKDDEISSHHFGERNTCLLSSRCCYMEGDNNWLWIQIYISVDHGFSKANLWCQYHLSRNKLWLWNISTKSYSKLHWQRFCWRLENQRI